MIDNPHEEVAETPEESQTEAKRLFKSVSIDRDSLFITPEHGDQD